MASRWRWVSYRLNARPATASRPGPPVTMSAIHGDQVSILVMAVYPRKLSRLRIRQPYCQKSSPTHAPVPTMAATQTTPPIPVETPSARQIGPLASWPAASHIKSLKLDQQGCNSHPGSRGNHYGHVDDQKTSQVGRKFFQIARVQLPDDK